MLSEIIEFTLENYYQRIETKIINARKLLSVGENFIELFDSKSFFKKLSDKLPGSILTSEFDEIISDGRIIQERRKELIFFRDRFEYKYFRFLDLLFFASESNFPITAEAMKELYYRFIETIAPLKEIYELLEQMLEEILEIENDLIEEDDSWC